MSRDRRSQQHVPAGVASGSRVGHAHARHAYVLGTSALAADIALKAPAYRAVYDWTGFYIGAHTGYSHGSSVATLTDPAASTAGNIFSGVIGGVQAGYNVRLPSGMLLGVEADMTFPNFLASNSVVSSLASARSNVSEQWDYVGTARGRIGYTNGHWLAYATGGLAWAGERFINTPVIGDEEKHINVRLGWAAGAGLEYAFAPHWSVKLEYLYSQFGRADVRFPSGTQYGSPSTFNRSASASTARSTGRDRTIGRRRPR